MEGETTPAVVIRPILPVPPAVNQSAPSGPTVIPSGSSNAAGSVNSLVTAPAVVMRPI